MAHKVKDDLIEDIEYLIPRFLEDHPKVKALRVRRGGPNSNVNIVQIEYMDDTTYNHILPKE